MRKNDCARLRWTALSLPLVFHLSPRIMSAPRSLLGEPAERMLAIIARHVAPVAGTRNRATGRPWLRSRHRSHFSPRIPNGANLVCIRTQLASRRVVSFTDDLSLGTQSGARTRASQSSSVNLRQLDVTSRYSLSILFTRIARARSLALCGLFSRPRYGENRFPAKRASGNDNSPISSAQDARNGCGLFKSALKSVRRALFGNATR